MVEEIRVVMVGKTGVGKSFLGNNILDQEVFRSEVGPQSLTKEAKKGERMIEKYCKLVLVDTPGLFETRKNHNMETFKDIIKALKLLSPGPHVFILVLSINFKYTAEEKAAIEFLKDLFGSRVKDYLIIVFIGKDALDHPKNKKDFKTYIKDADDDLKDLLSHCRGRVAINNRASREEVTRSVDNILHLIKRVYLQNKKKYYTDELLAEAKEKFEEKLRLQEEEAHKRERELEEKVRTLKEGAYERERELESETLKRDGDLYKNEMKEICIILFGKAGVGKSYLGNNILDQEVFPSEVGPQSITKEAKKGERMIEKDRKLVVVDTPGLYETRNNDNMAIFEILTSALKVTKPGPHVFIFVLSINSRFTAEEKTAFEFLKDLLGSSCTDYLIIVFTGKDTIDYQKTDLETYIDEAGDDLKNLLSQCRGIVAINNWASREEVTRSVDSLLAMIKDVYLQNGKTYYTDENMTEEWEKI